jgi:hypothetical protein
MAESNRPRAERSRNRDIDTVKGLRTEVRETSDRPPMRFGLDPEEFWRREARRDKILKMQEVLRPSRTTPVAVRFDRFTLKRLKTLAALHNKGYQTLLKEFVIERLYEEEKRAGILDELPDEVSG